MTYILDLVLFIGPGYNSRQPGQSVVLNIPSLTPAQCSPPLFPYGDEDGYGTYVGVVTDDGPMLCGGYTKHHDAGCYVLTRQGRWERRGSMNTARSGAAAVQTSAGWWVTGWLQYNKLVGYRLVTI